MPTTPEREVIWLLVVASEPERAARDQEREERFPEREPTFTTRFVRSAFVFARIPEREMMVFSRVNTLHEREKILPVAVAKEA